MKYFVSILMIFIVSCSRVQENRSLKETFEDQFTIGLALSDDIVKSTRDIELKNMINKEFNSIVAENCMKSEVIQPEEGVFDFDQSDRFVAFGIENEKEIIGHTLVWHSQAPSWFFTDSLGSYVSRDIMIARLEQHINELVGRYRGKVDAWDVVNEAIDDSLYLRRSLFYEIIGPDYIEIAFKLAAAADPDAKLYYNDYNLWKPEKREATIRMIKNLQLKNIPIHGVGMQAHLDLDTPLDEFEKSIIAFSELGIEIMLSELDISVLPFPAPELTAEVSTKYEYMEKYNPYIDSLPQVIEEKLAGKYADLFNILCKHDKNITRVTFWGLNDGTSWRNNWPIKGRVDYPLLFNRNNEAKQAYYSIISLKNQKSKK